MTARTTLSELIELLRGMTDAGTADYSIGSAHYWDGDHMQAALDRHYNQVWQEPLISVDTWIGGGSVATYDYQSGWRYFEQTNGGTAVFVIEDGAGSNIGTSSYSVDYINGRITFGTDTTGSAFYLTGKSYDVNAAAADIWRLKASHYASAYNFSADGQSFSRGQLIDNAMRMAQYYAAQAKPSVTVLVRGDVADDQ